MVICNTTNTALIITNTCISCSVLLEPDRANTATMPWWNINRFWWCHLTQHSTYALVLIYVEIHTIFKNKSTSIYPIVIIRYPSKLQQAFVFSCCSNWSYSGLEAETTSQVIKSTPHHQLGDHCHTVHWSFWLGRHIPLPSTLYLLPVQEISQSIIVEDPITYFVSG
jgi:hypothetical protein